MFLLASFTIVVVLKHFWFPQRSDLSFKYDTQLTSFDFMTQNVTLGILIAFWTPGLPEGVLCNHPCPSVGGPLVRPWSVFKYLRDRSNDSKVTEPDF